MSMPFPDLRKGKQPPLRCLTCIAYTTHVNLVACLAPGPFLSLCYIDTYKAMYQGCLAQTEPPKLGLWATSAEILQWLPRSLRLDRAHHVPVIRTSSSPSVRLLAPPLPSSPRAAAGSPGRDARRGPGSCRPWPLEVAAPSPGADAHLDESDVDCRCPCSAEQHLRHSLNCHVIATALFCFLPPQKSMAWRHGMPGVVESGTPCGRNMRAERFHGCSCYLHVAIGGGRPALRERKGWLGAGRKLHGVPLNLPDPCLHSPMPASCHRSSFSLGLT